MKHNVIVQSDHYYTDPCILWFFLPAIMFLIHPLFTGKYDFNSLNLTQLYVFLITLMEFLEPEQKTWLF